MIISCNNCNKKFEVNSNLIPDAGRLLQCSGCGNEWFFKHLSPIKVDKSDNSNIPTIFDNVSIEKELTSITKNNFGNQEPLIKKTKIEIPKPALPNEEPKNNKNIINTKNKKINILSIVVIFIISSAAIIILLDTFKSLISKIIPKIEFILYNLYESINDIILFFKDLI